MKTEQAPTIAAIATPLGEGGICVVQILGPKAIPIAEKIFRPTRPRDIRSLPEGRLCHGFIFDDSGPVDEVILRICPGDSLVEINCHGGIAAVKKIHDVVIRAGASNASPEDLLMATMGEGLDEIQQEALLLLPRAMTKLALKMLLAQCNGALSSRLAEIGRLSSRNAMLNGLRNLLQTADFGIGLCVPRRIVVAGKPNVGKSTLVNALLREDRVIVHHLPGTTRDAICEAAELHGIPFELVDTAGIRRTRDEIEALGVAESKKQIGAADIVLIVLDLSQPISPEDTDLLEIATGRHAVLVANKADKPPAWQPNGLQGPNALPISALTGAGLDRLEGDLVARLHGGIYRPEEPIVFTLRQRKLLASACTALEKEDMDKARSLIRKCLGRP